MSFLLRTATTQTTKCIRIESKQCFLSDFSREPLYRIELNIKQLTQILKYGHVIHEDFEEQQADNVKDGKKRTVPFAANTARAKRQKVRPVQVVVAEADSSEDEPRQVTMPVYSHTFEIAYTRALDGINRWAANYADDERAEMIGWLEEETELLKLLKAKTGDAIEPVQLDLGELSFHDHLGHIHLYHGEVPTDNLHYMRHLLRLPPEPFNDGEGLGDVFATCCSLKRSDHISLSSSASLVYTPGITSPDLPFQINISINISLVLPNIFKPYISHPAQKGSIAEERRRFLTYVLCPYDHENIAENGEEAELSIRQFYGILKPASDINEPVILDALQPKDLRATLLPFQRRSLKWLLERESMTVNNDGQVVPSPTSDLLPLFWRKVKPVAIPNDKGMSKLESGWWYFNRVTGNLVRERPALTDIQGGMLCEEMGLGKTLECIALILLNPPPLSRVPSNTRYDSTTELYVSEVKTNLIVTPATLAQQWVDELDRHAPSLKVLFYTGYNKVKLPKVDDEVSTADLIGGNRIHHAWCVLVKHFDVVVVTYKTLQEELGVAKAPVIRPKRQAAPYSHIEKARSPLVRVEWARVFMDEVQQVGGGKTAEMVSLIPRKVSIAVSGTPAKSKVGDLAHVLKFLGLEEIVGMSRTWERLLTPKFQDLFAGVFRKYAIRTLKASVKDELTIPMQKRYGVGIDLGKVERHIYDEALQEALDDLGVDSRGVASSEGWEIDIGLLRGWLRKLRQICTHPQVGHLNRAKIGKPSTIKTMQEVLQDLRDKNWQSLVTDRRTKIQASVRRAQLMKNVEEEEERHENARDVLLQAKTEVDQLIDDIQAIIDEHEDRGRKLKEETVRLRHQRVITRNLAENLGDGIKGKGKERETTAVYESDSEVDDDDLPRTPAGDEYRTRRRNLQAGMREALVLKHKVVFFLGDVYHVLEETHLEDDAYTEAEAIRRSLLRSTNAVAAASMELLLENFKKLTDVRRTDLRIVHCGKGGIRSALVLESANDVIDLLNEQGTLLWEWRHQIFYLLTEKLSNEEEKTDGEEYTRSLDTQGEVEAYLQAYAALVADRKEALIAERTTLAKSNAKEVVERSTKAARKAQNNEGFNIDADTPKPEEPDIELQAKLTHDRKAIRERHETTPLKAAMIQLGEIGNRAGNRSEENQIAKDESKRLRDIISQQGGFMEKLEFELASFRKVFNDRIQYFRQLQELSDTVMDAEWEGDVRVAIEVTKTDEDNLEGTINRKRAQRRHLDNIGKEGVDELGDARECVFCQFTFTVGLITPCAHVFCEPCLNKWIRSRHNDCPICRAKFKYDGLQRIIFDENNLPKNIKGKQVQSGNLPVGPDRSIRFNTLPDHILNLIQTYEAHGSYGSKIMHLVRHLLYLQDKEPGTKSVIFSAWSDSLTIIEYALTANGIACIKVDQKGKQNAAQRFKSDPGIIVFLLHGERENAGLNLTCAKRVWLLEPTVNHSFEIQAISRVDRMGQTAATEVYCYYIKDTVEENILRMGAKRGFSLYRVDGAEDMVDISEYSMGGPTLHQNSSKKAKQKGDYIEKPDDLLHVLFPHLDYDEEEILAASLRDNPEYVTMDVDYKRDNNFAGPSRLPLKV